MNKFLGVFEEAYLAVKTWAVTTQWLRVLKIGIAVTLAVLLIFVLAGSLVEAQSMFTISLIPADDESGEGVGLISLSETADFDTPKAVLDAGGLEGMTNISVNWLPPGLDAVDGSHNGEHYIAYTFYVKNAGETTFTLCETINLDSAVLGADEAIRVRVYRNGRSTDYAKIGVDGLPEYGTTPFESEDVVVEEKYENFSPGKIQKYTLVIWLEGDDPECLDNIKGGNVKMSMTFTAEATPQT